jgi:hypothetical protein
VINRWRSDLPRAAWSIRTLIRVKPDEARRIAANIAKLPAYQIAARFS